MHDYFSILSLRAAAARALENLTKWFRGSQRLRSTAELAAQQAGIEPFIAVYACFKAEAVPDPMLAGSTESRACGGIVRQFHNRCGKAIGISCWHHKTGLPVLNRFGVAAHISDDHRQARGHALENRVREPLLMRHQQSDVCRCQQSRDVAPGSEKMNSLRQTKIVDPPLQLVLNPVIAPDNKQAPL